MSHIMLHSDTLAQEFNEILNAVEIFAPFQPLDPAVTFYAPLRNTVRDLRLSTDDFQRNSDAYYKDSSGIYRVVGVNQPRFEESRLLMEPAKTNKCEVYSFPDNLLTGYALVGEGTLTRLQDQPAEFHGLGNGFCVDLDCTATDAGRVTFAGVTGNTNPHTLSAWVKKISGAGVCNLQFHAGGPAQSFANPQWERVTVYDETTATNNVGSVYVSAGARARVFLPQLEESPFVTSPIVTEGTAGQRAADLLKYLPAPGFFNESEGMALATVRFPYDLGPNILDYNAGLVSVSGTGNSVLYCRSDDAINLNLRSYVTNTNTGPSAPVNADDVWYIANRWYGDQFQVLGLSVNGGPWVWDSPYNSPLTWPLNGEVGIAIDNREPKFLSDVYIYNEDKGQAWIEENYP